MHLYEIIIAEYTVYLAQKKLEIPNFDKISCSNNIFALESESVYHVVIEY